MSKRLSRSTEEEESTNGVEQVGTTEQKKVERRGRKPKNATEPLTPKKARPSKSSKKHRRTHKHSEKRHHSRSSSEYSSSSSRSGSDGSQSSSSSSSSGSGSSSYDSDNVNSSDDSSSSGSSSGSSGSDTSSSDSGSERKMNRNRKKSRDGSKGSKKGASSDGDGDGDDEEEEVYCVCKKPYHHEFMFMCDRCQNWFHPKCVGLTKAEIKAHPDSQHYCTACRSALRQSSGSVAAPTSAPHQRTEKESTAATREQVSNAFTHLLELCASARGGDSEVFSTTARVHARKLGTELEAALFERSGKNTTGAVYVARARFLLHNLDPKTTTLGKRVLSGELAPAVVALTDPRTLATKHIALPPSLTTPVPHVVPLPSSTPPEHKTL